MKIFICIYFLFMCVISFAQEKDPLGVGYIDSDSSRAQRLAGLSWVQKQKLSPALKNPRGIGAFGGSVSISGDLMIVGSRREAMDHGAVYFYNKNESGPNNWGKGQSVISHDYWMNEQFGFSVSISGEYAFVSVTGADRLYIFRRNSGSPNNWILSQEIIGKRGNTCFDFSKVSISGGFAIVGSPYDPQKINKSEETLRRGAAYIFHLDPGTGEWREVKKLTVSDAKVEGFGWAVSISDDHAIIGAHFSSDKGVQSGSAYIFSRNKGGQDNWGQVEKLTASDGAGLDQFGECVSISSEYALVGAHWNDDKGDNSGSAYIFHLDQGTGEWREVKKLTASDAAAGDYFGCSVSISGNRAIVGANGDGDNGYNSGSAYIFARDQGGSNNWGEEKRLLASDGTAEDSFGCSVLISGERAVVGAEGYNNYVGAVYIYEYSSDVAITSEKSGTSLQDGNYTVLKKYFWSLCSVEMLKESFQSMQLYF